MTALPRWLCVALLIAMASACSGSGPAATAERFFRLVERGDVERATGMLTGQMVAMLGPAKIQAALAEQSRVMAGRGGVAGVEVLSEEATDQTATVRLRVSYENGETQEETVQLVWLDGAWKINPVK